MEPPIGYLGSYSGEEIRMFLLRADKLLIARRKNILSTEKNIFLRAENIITARSYFFRVPQRKFGSANRGEKMQQEKI
jgi:hypothetical protein